MKTHTEILIVEDSPTQALLLQQLLEQHQYRVTVASDGIEALARLEDHQPDLVISDIVMPEMDGYVLCEKIKERDELCSIPVILLTTLSEPKDIVRGLECGANHFITKPYEKDSLLSAIQYVMVNQEIRKTAHSEMGIEIFFAGKKHFINSGRIQILDLLFSSYENAMHQKRELERVNEQLAQALDTIKTLKGIIPICSYCKKIRDDEGSWKKLEAYIHEHSDAQFSHGICPDCAKKISAEIEKL